MNDPTQSGTDGRLRILLGGTWLRRDDLNGLTVGSVIQLEAPAEAEVDICVDGRRVARGRAVDVGGKLCVQISKVEQAT